MMSTDTTALCRRYPLTNLQHRTNTLWDWCLIFFDELTEGKVGYLFPQRRFIPARLRSSKNIISKLRAEVYRKFPLMIRSLIGSLFMQACDGLSGAFSVVRTLNLSRMMALCFCQLSGIVFVQHWRRVSLTLTASQEVL